MSCGMRIRVATYNIHKGIGGVDRRYRPERVRDTIALFKPDFVLLQEVDEGCGRTDGHRQVDLLGDLLGLRHRTYFPNVRTRGGGHYGNAILSRFPLTETSNIDLTVPSTKRRSVLHARFRVRGEGVSGGPRTIHVFNLHLGLSAVLRRMQIRKFLESHPFANVHPRTPIVVAGDFNDVGGSLGPEFLIPAGFRTGPTRIRTFPAWAPIWPLDGIYVRGDVELLNIHRPREKVARVASDHLPLFAEIKLG
jgi:endonuclease/exonuclease/phosphatase family metal-dependent hydrolase